MDLVQLAVVERLRLQLRLRGQLHAGSTASGEPNYNFGTQAFDGGRGGLASGVFRRDETGRVFLTYQSFSRGLDMLNGAYDWLDLTSKAGTRTTSAPRWSGSTATTPTRTDAPPFAAPSAPNSATTQTR